MSSGKCKLKQGDTTTYLLECLNFKTPTPNDGEDLEQLELSFIADENAKWYTTLEDNLAVSYKTKRALTI